MNFDNFRKKTIKRPSQIVSSGLVGSRTRGRPKKPNRVHMHLRLDYNEKKWLENESRNRRMTLSAFVSLLIEEARSNMK